MHPIERLRLLARADDLPVEWLIDEAAEALSDLADDRKTLVSAARSLIDHRPHCGPLWWLCTRLSVARDVRTEASLVMSDLAHDATSLHVSLALSDAAEQGCSVLEATMASTRGAFVEHPEGRIGEVDKCGADSRNVWLVLGVGTVAPDRVFLDAGKRRERLAFDAPTTNGFVEAARIVRVIGPDGVGEPLPRLGRPEFSVVPELLARG